MKRLLKKEWDETEIAPHILWQTRNRAWQKLRQSKRRRRLRLAAGGALAAMAALLLLWVRSPSGLPSAPPVEVASTNPQTPADAEEQLIEPDRPALQPAEPQRTEIAEDAMPARQPVQRSAARQDGRQAETATAEQPALNPQPAAPAEPELDRLVMNFRLPQSGVRMIWIKQRTSPPSSGGTG